MQRSCRVRHVALLSEEILESGYCLTSVASGRFFAKDAKEREDSGAVRRYLIEETSAPNCSKLEAVLCKVLRKLPEWGEILANVVLDTLLCRPQQMESWMEAVRNIIDKGLHALARKAKLNEGVGYFSLPRAFQTAVLKLALKTPGHEESLKAAFADAFADTFQSIEYKWQGSFADELFQVTMPKWQKAINALDIESLSKDPEVEYLAYYTRCLVPFNEDGDKKNTLQNEEKKKKVRNKRRQELRSKDRRKEQRNNFVGKVLKAFMEEARPILEAAYGKSPGTSTDGIEGLMDQMPT